MVQKQKRDLKQKGSNWGHAMTGTVRDMYARTAKTYQNKGGDQPKGQDRGGSKGGQKRQRGTNTSDGGPVAWGAKKFPNGPARRKRKKRIMNREEKVQLTGVKRAVKKLVKKGIKKGSAETKKVRHKTEKTLPGKNRK